MQDVIRVLSAPDIQKCRFQLLKCSWLDVRENSGRCSGYCSHGKCVLRFNKQVLTAKMFLRKCMSVTYDNDNEYLQMQDLD